MCPGHGLWLTCVYRYYVKCGHLIVMKTSVTSKLTTLMITVGSSSVGHILVTLDTGHKVVLVT